MNVGGGQVGENGLRDNRLYNHMNIQPVVHLEPGGQTAKGRWRAFAMFGSFGGGATWAEGVYEMTYAKVDGVWKIKKLDYHSGFGAPYATGWVPPEPAVGRRLRRAVRATCRIRPIARATKRATAFPAACVAPFHYTQPGMTDAGHVWTTVTLPPRGRPTARRRASVRPIWQRARSCSPTSKTSRTCSGSTATTSTARMWDQVADLFADDGTIEMGIARRVRRANRACASS